MASLVAVEEPVSAEEDHVNDNSGDANADKESKDGAGLRSSRSNSGSSVPSGDA